MFEQGSLFWIVMPVVLVVVFLMGTQAARVVKYFARRDLEAIRKRKLEAIRKREQEGSTGQ